MSFFSGVRIQVPLVYALSGQIPNIFAMMKLSLRLSQFFIARCHSILDRQTDTHTHTHNGTDFIPSTADAGGKNTIVIYCRMPPTIGLQDTVA